MAMHGVRDGPTEKKELVIVIKNPVAKELRTKKYRPKVVRNKKKYDRKYNAAIAYHEMLKFFRNNNVD
jgi:hypothetical protein|tara:strand:+ start:628 stop:831 length:204 start_codon:yes stop_codon:yes gene_type:complete